MGFGGQSMVGDLKEVLVKKPDSIFADADPKIWHYTHSINLKRAQIEHQDLVRVLESNGVQVYSHYENMKDLSDAMFVHDPMLMTDAGAVILRMGKTLRQGEEAYMKRKMQDLGIPILGEIEEPGCVEGGDLIWLDDRTLLAGRGYRTNLAGILQLRELLQTHAIATLPFDLPYYEGPEACLHLQSLMSLVDVDLAVCYLPLMPAPLVDLLRKRKFEIIEVSEEEFKNYGTNILALKPKVVLTSNACPELKKRMEAKDIQVFTYSGEELTQKAEGGATCLTRPLQRLKVRDRYGELTIYG